MNTTLRLLLVVMGTLICAVPAHADQAAFYGAEASMTAASNMALVRQGGAVWYNPAGLDGPDGNRFDVSASAFVLRVRDFSDVVRTRLPSGLHKINALTFDIVPIPSALVYYRRLSKRWTGAIAVLVTQADSYAIGGRVESTEQFPGHPNPVEVSGSGSISYASQTYRIGPVFAAKVTPRFRIGFGFYLIYQTLKDSSHLLFQAEDGPTGSVAFIQSLSQRRFSWFGGQLSFGLQWNVAAGLHLGLTLRSPALAALRFGSVNLATSAISSGSAFPGPQFVETVPPKRVQGEGLALEPGQLILGMAYRFRKFWLGLEVEVSHALWLKAFETHYKWNLNARVGGRFWIRDKFSVGFGLFTDRSPKRELSDWLISDSYTDYYGVVCGFEWRSIYHIRKGAQNHRLLMRTTITVRYAVGPGKLAAMDHGPAEATMQEMARLGVDPRDTLFHALSLQISASLSF